MVASPTLVSDLHSRMTAEFFRDAEDLLPNLFVTAFVKDTSHVLMYLPGMNAQVLT